MVPKQKKLKFLLITPPVEIAAPAKPNIAPVINPNRRPTLPINKEAGIVVAICAKKNRAKGSVARNFTLASASPTKADDASNVDAPIMSRPWLNERSNTLCFITEFFWCCTLCIALPISSFVSQWFKNKNFYNLYR